MSPPMTPGTGLTLVVVVATSVASVVMIMRGQ